MNMTVKDAKSAAQALRRSLAADDGVTITHSRALEIVSGQLGFPNWNTAAAHLGTRPTFGVAVPVLRVQNEQLARSFYVNYLGFELEWQHRFEPDLPLYFRVSRGDAVLDLSEHHGDGTPGSAVWIPVADVAKFHAEITRRPHPKLRPGIEHDAPGGPTVEVIDPFGNILRFCEPAD